MTDSELHPTPRTLQDFRMVGTFMLTNLGHVMRGEDRDQLMVRLQGEGYDGDMANAYASLVELIRDIAVREEP